LQYVLSLEGDSCFSSDKVASSADVYLSNYNEKGVYRGAAVTNISLTSSARNGCEQPQKSSVFGNMQAQPSVPKSEIIVASPVGAGKDGKGKKGCWGCGSDKHRLAQCPEKGKKSTSGGHVAATVPVREAKGYACVAIPVDRPFGTKPIPAGVDNVKQCSGSSSHGELSSAARVSSVETDVGDHPIGANHVTIKPGEDIVSSGLRSLARPQVGSSCTDGLPVNSPIAEAMSTSELVARTNGVVNSQGLVLSPLHYIDVCINGKKVDSAE
jgi:hypothetical protein